jgi:TRAP-type C4-dicarboxylate transport system substrate-binding protein
MDILDKLKNKTQDVVRGAKDYSDTARQKSLIAEEEKKIAALYEQTGKNFYETQQPDPETPLGKFCLAIKASFDRISGYEEEIRKIKDVKQTPSGGAVKRFCTGCGAGLVGGTAFCASCGQKQ